MYCPQLFLFSFLQYIAHINFMSKLPVQSQAGWMSVRAGKVRSKSTGVQSGDGTRGNGDMRSCEVAVRLRFPKYQSRIKARTEGKGVKKSVFGCDPSKAVLKSCERYLLN